MPSDSVQMVVGGDLCITPFLAKRGLPANRLRSRWWQAGFFLGIVRRSTASFLEKNAPTQGKSLAKAQILLYETFGNSY